MPNIKITDLKAVAPQLSPDNTIPGISYLNKYDAGLRQEMNQEWNRSNNQGFGEQLMSGLVSRGASIGTKFVGGLANVGAFAVSPLTREGLSYTWNNPISKAMNNLDDDLRELLPVYKSKQYSEGDLLSMMGTSSFWFDDGFDGIAYLISARMGGGVGKGIAAAGKELATVVKGGISPVAKFFGAVDESLVSAAKTFGELPGGMPTAKLADSGLQAIDDALRVYVATPTAKAALLIQH